MNLELRSRWPQRSCSVKKKAQTQVTKSNESSQRLCLRVLRCLSTKCKSAAFGGFNRLWSTAHNAFSSICVLSYHVARVLRQPSPSRWSQPSRLRVFETIWQGFIVVLLAEGNWVVRRLWWLPSGLAKAHWMVWEKCICPILQRSSVGVPVSSTVEKTCRIGHGCGFVSGPFCVVFREYFCGRGFSIVVPAVEVEG